MKTEIYKGVEIVYDDLKKTFFTKAVIRIKGSGKNREYISSKKKDLVKADIDKTLGNLAEETAKQAWLSGAYEDSQYKLVDIIFHDIPTNTITIKKSDGKIITIALTHYKYNTDRVFLSTKHNDKIVAQLEKMQVEINLMKKAKKDLKTTLIPVKQNNFK